MIPPPLVSATVGFHDSSSPCVPKTLDALVDMREPGEADDDTSECELRDVFAQRQMPISVHKTMIYHLAFYQCSRKAHGCWHLLPFYFLF